MQQPTTCIGARAEVIMLMILQIIMFRISCEMLALCFKAYALFLVLFLINVSGPTKKGHNHIFSNSCLLNICNLATQYCIFMKPLHDARIITQYYAKNYSSIITASKFKAIRTLQFCGLYLYHPQQNSKICTYISKIQWNLASPTFWPALEPFFLRTVAFLLCSAIMSPFA